MTEVKRFVQYAEDGASIVGSVTGVDAPDHIRQVEVDLAESIVGKEVSGGQLRTTKSRVKPKQEPEVKPQHE
jgi:hypothetical protein